MKRTLLGFMAAATVAAGVSSTNADVLDDWAEVWLDTIRVTGGPPCPIARNQAVLFAGIYDAVNSINGRSEPYINFIELPGPSSKEAAIAAAAHHALVELYPARQAIYDEQLEASLDEIPNGPAKENGILVGIAAAEQILEARRFDFTSSNPGYVYLDTPGSYQPTPPDFTQPPFNPGWGSTLPWTMDDGSQFRPKGPNGFRRLDKLLKSGAYAKQLNEVKEFGRRDSSVRSPEQTEIAWFWANDRDGTYKPPGQLVDFTRTVANDQGLSLDEKVQLFGLVGIALGDAGLVAWDMKYSTDVDLWRPVTAIREADTDDNSKTEPDAQWLPLLEFSPPFPAYTSGHATFGAAHAAVMAGYFGTDEMTFTIGTDEPIVSNVTRTFERFSDAGRENGVSRVYLGVHFRFDADIGYVTGTKLGKYVVKNHMRVVGCVADFNADGAVTIADLNAFTRRYERGDAKADINNDGAVDVFDLERFMDFYADGCN